MQILSKWAVTVAGSWSSSPADVAFANRWMSSEFCLTVWWILLLDASSHGSHLRRNRQVGIDQATNHQALSPQQQPQQQQASTERDLKSPPIDDSALFVFNINPLVCFVVVFFTAMRNFNMLGELVRKSARFSAAHHARYSFYPHPHPHLHLHRV